MEIILSSAKRGYGLKELISESAIDYWSTDDNLPHYIHITFAAKTYVYSVNMLLSFNEDESYTPEKIAVHFNGKQKNFVLNEPDGMKEFPINEFVFDIYVVISSNHSEGKDSHVRTLKVMESPSEEIKINGCCF